APSPATLPQRERDFCSRDFGCVYRIRRRQRHDAPMPRLTPARSRILPIAPKHWAPPLQAIELDGLRLTPKPELHITLIGTALAAELHAAFGPSAGTLVGAAQDAQDWRFERSGRYLLLRKPFTGNGRTATAHALVERIDLPAMAPFHRALGRLLGRQLPVPPPHVTLYTAGRPQGIGLSSPSRLRAFTVRRVEPVEPG